MDAAPGGVPGRERGFAVPTNDDRSGGSLERLSESARAVARSMPRTSMRGSERSSQQLADQPFSVSVVLIFMFMRRGGWLEAGATEIRGAVTVLGRKARMEFGPQRFRDNVRSPAWHSN